MSDGKYFWRAVSIRPPAARFTHGGHDEIHVADLRRGAGVGPDERGRAAAGVQGIRAILATDQVERPLRGRIPVAPGLVGDERSGTQRETAPDRRSLRGDARAARR